MAARTHHQHPPRAPAKHPFEPQPMKLAAELTARVLMTADPVSIRDSASVKEAAAVLTDGRFSALPVIDEDGKLVGVLSRADIVRLKREEQPHIPRVPDYYERIDLTETTGDLTFKSGFQLEENESTDVRDIMTPVVISVAPDATAETVVRTLLESRVHRLFVLADDKSLLGVISALDLLKVLVPD